MYQIKAKENFSYKKATSDDGARYLVGGKAFLVTHKNSIEVRTDARLGKLLTEKYESVMQSRYFGRGGIEIVLAGQLTEADLDDLVRLSYNMTEKCAENI